MMIWNLRQGCVMFILGHFLMVPMTSLSEEVVEKLVSNADTKPINVAVDGKSGVWEQFEHLFGAVTEQLSNHQQMYVNNPVAYYEFLSSTVIELWDSSSTTRALIGKAHYSNLTEEQRIALVENVDQTLIRYAFEGLESYGDQEFKVDDVVVNEEQGMGWVQVLMESPVLPDINLDILIKRISPDAWRAVDIRVKGITYVAIKKRKYREILEEQGFSALIDNLKNKNIEYFDAICAANGASKELGKAPC